MVGNLKVIILTATLRNWSQIKKKLKKNEARFLDLDIKIMGGRVRIGLSKKVTHWVFLSSECQKCLVIFRLP